jgi:phosphoesterase RecJ-like protein
LALEKQIPDNTVAIEDFDPTLYQFLPGIDKATANIGSKSLVVSIDVGENPIEKINYNADGAKFNLILTPKTGQVDVDQIEYSYTGIDYDAIIAVDTATRELLGTWADSFATELADTPFVNIDHHPTNTHFGTINFVDADAPSATVVIYHLLQQLNLEITPDIATNLLAGLLSDTSGFANSNASPLGLRTAAELVERGVNYHQLSNNLFRTLSVPAMRLWGDVLHNIQVEEPGIVYSQLGQGEITEAQATDADVSSVGGVINNILVADRSMKLAVLLKDKGEGEISGSLRAIGDVNVATIAEQLGGGGHVRAAGFRLLNATLAEAKEKVLQAIRSQIHAEGDQQAE